MKSKPQIELMETLSDNELFSVFRVMDGVRKIGYFSVYKNGKFKYNILDDNTSEEQLYTLACNYIQEVLGSNPKLITPQDNVFQE